MSRNAVRTGPGIAGTVTTAGTPGASDEVRNFLNSSNKPVYCRPCVVVNTHASDVLYVLPNSVDCSPTNYLAKCAAGQAVDISIEGQIDVETVSLYYATAAYSAALAWGWIP